MCVSRPPIQVLDRFQREPFPGSVRSCYPEFAPHTSSTTRITDAVGGGRSPAGCDVPTARSAEAAFLAGNQSYGVIMRDTTDDAVSN
jgi:hypothetical protein